MASHQGLVAQVQTEGSGAEPPIWGDPPGSAPASSRTASSTIVAIPLTPWLPPSPPSSDPLTRAQIKRAMMAQLYQPLLGTGGTGDGSLLVGGLRGSGRDHRSPDPPWPG